ncbi:DNA cytosine methyltransferase, partial [Parabacteroides goldsteinii]|uniref:DNA cytosine methyltransferase n=1 Tax=Parabacteroides goldsteinii TaxID=328812 RepID=UPI00262E5076
PEYTMTTQHNYGVVGMPIPIEKTLGTLTTVDSHALLGVPFVVENRGQSNTRAIDQAMSTQTSMITHGIASTEAVNAFLAYYYGNNQASGMFDPVGTISTKDRIALVLSDPKNIDINDCTYRMLSPHEVQAAMAFESDYIVCGTGKDKVKQLGNAVTPPAMEWLLERYGNI